MTRALVLALLALSLCAIGFVYAAGHLLYYGDAEAHLNIARRIVDSRTPGWGQLGTAWLPLPHLLMIPFVRSDWLWRTGLAGAISSGACFVAAGSFLFAALRRTFHRTAPAVAGTALFALNPNLLYLQSIPMTEAVFFAALMALLYCTVRFRQTQSLWTAAGAGLAALAGLLTRYEGWFLLPFAAAFFLHAAGRRKLPATALFCAIPLSGVLWWLAYNWWFFGNALAFYNGPFSAKAIQGAAFYAGKDDWKLAWLYFRTAAALCIGAPLYWLGVAGLAPALKRAAWPAILLALPPIFYVWSIHSSGNPIHVPGLWPHSWYNTRYGLALLPLAALAAASLCTLVPRRLEIAAAGLTVALGILPWLLHPQPENWITWKESTVNSEARREWTRLAADFVETRIGRNQDILTSFGDYTGIYRRAAFPLRRTLTGDNEPQWQATVLRPDLLLWEPWVLAMDGDEVQRAMVRLRDRGPHYELVRRIAVKGAAAIEIYHVHDSSLPESARREE